MSFSAEWLALRADADRRARDAMLAADLAEALFEIDPLRVLDLGSGTGANMAALSPLFGPNQNWVLVDHDAGLLDQVKPDPGIKVDRRVFDLSGDLAPLFDPAPHLVTASAFFDLAGEVFIDRLVERVVAAQAAFHTVLTYDGREEWHPAHPLDTEVLTAFHADQHADKGLGTALGPEATPYLVHAFGRAGYDVRIGDSPWQLTKAEDADLIAALAEGSAAAVASRVGGDDAETWRVARTKADSVLIGHQDILALPLV